MTKAMTYHVGEILGPGERAMLVNGRLSHHRVVSLSGQPHDAHTPATPPLTDVQTARCVAYAACVRHGKREIGLGDGVE